jgi:hypothetical protein
MHWDFTSCTAKGTQEGGYANSAARAYLNLSFRASNIHGLISHSRRTLPFTVTTPSSRDTGAVLRVLGRVCSLLRFDVNHRLWPLASQYTTAPSNYKFAI